MLWVPIVLNAKFWDQIAHASTKHQQTQTKGGRRSKALQPVTMTHRRVQQGPAYAGGCHARQFGHGKHHNGKVHRFGNVNDVGPVVHHVVHVVLGFGVQGLIELAVWIIGISAKPSRPHRQHHFKTSTVQQAGASNDGVATHVMISTRWAGSTPDTFLAKVARSGFSSPQYSKLG